MKKIIAIVFTLISLQLFAQHQHDMHNMNRKDTIPSKDTMMKMEGMDMEDKHHHTQMPGMNHAYSLSLPMNRNGSGTAWSPDNTPCIC